MDGLCKTCYCDVCVGVLCVVSSRRIRRWVWRVRSRRIRRYYLAQVPGPATVATDYQRYLCLLN